MIFCREIIPSSCQYLLKDTQHDTRARRPRETLSLLIAALDQRLAQIIIQRDAPQAAGNLLNTQRIDLQRGLARHFWQRRGITAQHGHAAGHRFEDGKAKAFIQ